MGELNARHWLPVSEDLCYLQNYDELAELASQGNSREVDFFNSDFFTSDPHLAEGDTSMYAKAMDITSENSMLIYCFGKCTDLKKDGKYSNRFYGNNSTSTPVGFTHRI